jgi:hypothetical protein
MSVPHLPEPVTQLTAFPLTADQKVWRLIVDPYSGPSNPCAGAKSKVKLFLSAKKKKL